MRTTDGLGATIDIPASLVDSFSKKIVAEATPQVHYLIAYEKGRISDATYKSLPFVGGSVVVFLGTLFLVPDHKVYKAIGYLLSAGLLGGSILMFMSEMGIITPLPAPPPAPEATPATPAAPADNKSYQLKFSL